MSEALKSWAFHALQWVVLYAAFAERIEGALSVLKFWVWVVLLLSLFSLSDTSVSTAAFRPLRPTLRRLSIIQAWVTLGLLVWFGHIASGFAWAFSMLAFGVHRDMADKLRAAALNAKDAER